MNTARDTLRRLAGRTLHAAIRGWLGFSLRSTRWTLDVAPEARDLLFRERTAEEPGLLLACWHEALILSPAIWWWIESHNPTLQLHVLISRNRDGRLIADIVAPWRIPAIHGSSDRRGKDKGGATALRRIRQVLKTGHVVALTPDGPQGPRREVQIGVVALAEQAGAPIIPLGAVCRSVRARSWDRMILPLPFGRGRIVCGPPLHVTRGARSEAAAALKVALDDAMETAAQPAPDYPYRLASMPDAATEEKAAQEPEQISLPALHPVRHTVPGALWAVLATGLTPALRVMLRIRLRRGKELPERLRERTGRTCHARPPGQPVWLHAASVGETISLLPVLRALLADDAAMTVLVTTGTVTAAQTLAREMVSEIASGRVIQQFVPLDVPRWIGRFLAHWRPACLILTESELWPNMIAACCAVRIPVAIVNGRLSPSAFRGWRRVPALAQRMMAGLSWVAARSTEDAARFRILGAARVFCAGDLKTAAPPLSCDDALLTALRARIGARPVWIAASTHEGEEDAIFQATEQLRHHLPDALTIIAPRHPDRGAAIAQRAARLMPDGNPAPRRALGELPSPEAPVWVADTLGELGTLFRLSRVVFMGNSLFTHPGRKESHKGGGHNPFEPARLGCAIATGPRIRNFAEAYAEFGDIVTIVSSASDLAHWVQGLLAAPARAAELGEAGKAIATRNPTLPGRLAALIHRTAAP